MLLVQRDERVDVPRVQALGGLVRPGHERRAAARDEAGAVQAACAAGADAVRARMARRAESFAALMLVWNSARRPKMLLIICPSKIAWTKCVREWVPSEHCCACGQTVIRTSPPDHESMAPA